VSTSEQRTARRSGISDLLRRTALRDPHRTALVFGERTYSFRALDEAVDRLAAGLADRGARKGDRVALLSHNCDYFVLAYFALARLGAISVPVNFMLTAPEVAYILEHSGATGVLAEDALTATVDATGAQLSLRVSFPLTGNSTGGNWTDVGELLINEPGQLPDALIEDDEPIQLMYTSGTESRPKGAMMTSRSLIAQYTTCVVDGEMSRNDIEVHSLPLYHCAQLHCFLTPDIWLGAKSILLPAPEPGSLLETLERERATKLFCPPTVWIALLRHPDFDRCDLSSLRKGYYGAAIMPTEVLQELARRLPSVRLFNFYGQTEMAPLATILRPEEQLTKLGSAGRPGLNVETAVVDDRNQPVPPGTIGEIVHRSPHAMLGYWNDPQKTAEAFRDGWFHSGDLGVLDEDGYLSVVDRKKDMIKTGGENVASREVEEAVYGHPDVAEVAVFGVPHPYWIEAVVAVVVPKSGAEVDAQAVLAHCRTQLAGYKVPKAIVISDALPKNPSGKILKRDLRASYATVLEGAGDADSRSTS
jgi:fatty-acyl-CoA synthase